MEAIYRGHASKRNDELSHLCMRQPAHATIGILLLWRRKGRIATTSMPLDQRSALVSPQQPVLSCQAERQPTWHRHPIYDCVVPFAIVQTLIKTNSLPL